MKQILQIQSFPIYVKSNRESFFGHAILYIRTSMCSLCICVIQFLATETSYFSHFSSNNVQMQRKPEGLGQIYTRFILCGQHIRLGYDKQK